jgi:uncharacterized protein involved in exopolysaccharide biosynthesis/Mrp family chromosome partitioning ATPase
MKTPLVAQIRTDESPSPGLNLGDFYYIFFRHKWKILLIFLAGVLGSVACYVVKPPLYQSETEILIRYIVEGKTATSAKDDSQIKPLDSGGANIINSEIVVLTSLDLAALVADAVGPEKILAKLGGGNDRLRAAGVIHQGLLVEVPRNSNVLLITFRHPDAAVVQPVLSQLADTYLKRHVEIHQGVGVLHDSFSRQAEQLRVRLATTEADLKKLKTEAQVISLDESKRDCMDRMVKIRQELLTAEADLAERRTMLGEQDKLFPATMPATNMASVVTPEQSEQYRRACTDLDALHKQLAELRTKYRDKHFQVLNVLQQVSEAEGRKKELEVIYPQLTRLAPLSATDAPRNQVDLSAESRRVAALEAKIKWLASQLEIARTDASRVMDAEPAIAQLQRKKEVEENSYRLISSRLEQARDDETLGAGKITNISVVQTPSPPARDLKVVLKRMLIIFLIGCFGGFGLGFVSERILDRTIKCVADVERQVRVPLFLSVPDTTWKPGFHLPRSARIGHQNPVATNGKGEPRKSDASPAIGTAVSLWNPHHTLRPHFEGLRDRLITYFEVHAMNHKPKMVAVTSCNGGAGVTTMAAGLAAALSETGDGNVLLVDMNLEQGAAHAFYQGKPSCGLSEVLENGTRDSAFVQENLYLVSAHETNNQKLPRVLPKRFANLVPRMKASDYDYIIFDMPPVTQTSVTARLAGFMDMVLVVIESEKTGQEIVQRANGLLHESRANVAAILNKHRAYVPHKFSQEL